MGHEPVEVEHAPGCLLEAVEHGLHLGRGLVAVEVRQSRGHQRGTRGTIMRLSTTRPRSTITSPSSITVQSRIGTS